MRLLRTPMRPRLCSLLGVATELPKFPLSFSVAIWRMGSFVLVVLAHSMAESVLRRVFPLCGPANGTAARA
jgi:hypothetical protein